jgi:O-methyltransferase involved in polyketide biosynthesis
MFACLKWMNRLRSLVKRERLAAAEIQTPDNLTFVTCNFSRDNLPQVLADAGFDRTKPAVVAWLGVTMYLEREDVFETLRYLASLPPRSRSGAGRSTCATSSGA